MSDNAETKQEVFDALLADWQLEARSYSPMFEEEAAREMQKWRERWERADWKICTTLHTQDTA